jgi:hypothetical protein
MLTRAPGMIDIDRACFTAFDACAAASIKPSALRDWFNREPAIILLRKNDRQTAGLDRAPLLTLRRVYQIALTAELIRLGVMAQRAANLAAMFTDLDGGEKPAKGRSHANDAIREAGRLFPSGGTFLVANKDGMHGPIIAAVINGMAAERLGRHHASAVVVDVEALVHRVLLSLRLADVRTAQAMEPVISQFPPRVWAATAGVIAT